MKIMSKLRNIKLLTFICVSYSLIFFVINGINYDSDHQTNHLSDIRIKEKHRSSKIKSSSLSSELKTEKIPLDLSKSSSYVNFAHTVEGNFCYNNSANYLNSDISSYMKKGDYRSLYRSAMDYAINKISTIQKREFVVSCSFPGFDKKESYEIWNLAERRMRIKHTCKTFINILQSEPYKKQLYWDKERNLGYCGQFKAGTTTWMKQMLDWNGVKSSPLDTRKIDDQINKLPPLLTDETVHNITKENPLIFSFVRHPLSRLVSTYLTKIKKPDYNYSPLIKKWISDVRGKSLVTIVEEIKENIIENYDFDERSIDKLLHIDKITSQDENHVVQQTNSTDENLSFREFSLLAGKQILECFNDVECLLDIDPHWQPQYVRCNPCQIEIDVPGQVESFEKDSNILLKILNNDTSMNRELNVELSDHYEEEWNITTTYLDTLNDEELLLIVLAYTFDFNLSGYSLNQYLNPDEPYRMSD